jgi:hypothetical protein
MERVEAADVFILTFTQGRNTITNGIVCEQRVTGSEGLVCKAFVSHLLPITFLSIHFSTSLSWLGPFFSMPLVYCAFVSFVG